jgi:hypothetical protein
MQKKTKRPKPVHRYERKEIFRRNIFGGLIILYGRRVHKVQKGSSADSGDSSKLPDTGTVCGTGDKGVVLNEKTT